MAWLRLPRCSATIERQKTIVCGKGPSKLWIKKKGRHQTSKHFAAIPRWCKLRKLMQCSLIPHRGLKEANCLTLKTLRRRSLSSKTSQRKSRQKQHHLSKPKRQENQASLAESAQWLVWCSNQNLLTKTKTLAELESNQPHLKQNKSKKNERLKSNRAKESKSKVGKAKRENRCKVVRAWVKS